jgi:isocitrate dehydrogenase kinase/phosphatase
MKKLFISCPMKGRTEENIRTSMDRMHRVAELVFDQELEVIQFYIDETAPENVNPAIWYLGESIKRLAEADYFIGIDYSSEFKGCNHERDVAYAYGIPVTMVNTDRFMPDVREIELANDL